MRVGPKRCPLSGPDDAPISPCTWCRAFRNRPGDEPVAAAAPALRMRRAAPSTQHVRRVRATVSERTHADAAHSQAGMDGGGAVGSGSGGGGREEALSPEL